MRLVVAIFVTAVIGTILAPFSSFTPEATEPIFAGITLLHIESALSWLFAVAIGALVSRKNFVLPAVVLTTATWAVLAFIVYQVARVAEPTSLAAVAAQQLPALLLMALSACVGALLGRWFFLQHLKEHPGPV